MIQQVMAEWADSAPPETLQLADRNLNRINDMLTSSAILSRAMTDKPHTVAR